MSDEPFVVISSDGHAGARMADYRPYLDAEFREEFDSFVRDWNDRGSRNFDPPALQSRLDPEFVDDWQRKMFDTGRANGFSDAHQRLAEVEKEGVAGEVIFPDFGLPFQLFTPHLTAVLGLPPLDVAHKRAGMRAFNRWVVDYVSVAPHRFAAMATVSWEYGVEEAVEEIRWARDHGIRGVLLPEFGRDRPLFHPDFAPIWQALEECGMVVNSHSGMSSTSNDIIYTPGLPHPACAFRIRIPEAMFYCQNILSHLLWGGVMERHPDLRFVFTEQGSGWVIAVLQSWDHIYERSYFRTDYHDVIRTRPSEYFARQCAMGSSIFSLAEVEARHQIGIERMMLGMDFPHHEGTLVETTQEYLRATLGAAGVPVDEARRVLGLNAAALFGFDLDLLAPVAAAIGPRPDEILVPPTQDLFPRGDVKKPLYVNF